MPVERIKLTPNSMVVKSASGNVVFDTQNKYIKTAAGGNLLVNKQVATPFYYTAGGVVSSPIINGAIMKSVSRDSMLAGAQVSFRYPEWTGGFTMCTDDRPPPPGRAAGLTTDDMFGIKVYLNSSFLTHIFVGGIDVISVTCNSGDLITVGGIDRFSGTGVLEEVNTSSFNYTFISAMRVHFFAYQSSGTSLPLAVTA
jgi:hypothetical protein